MASHETKEIYWMISYVNPLAAIDSFGLGLTPIEGYGSKQQLADLCGMKMNCLGFISMPSAKIFRESTNPSFVNDDGKTGR